MEIRIAPIMHFPEAASLLSQVLSLSDMEKKTLGLIPRGAFEKIAENDELIVAAEGNTLYGYLVYRASRKRSRASIAQLCVSREHRGLGISHYLIEEVKRLCISFHLSGILIKTRNDYAYAERVWSREGFVPRLETLGRGKDKATLVHWWWANGDAPDLFSGVNAYDENKILVGIDLNILISLHDGENIVEILSSGWLLDEIDLAAMPESYKEILRHTDLSRRNTIRSFISSLAEPAYSYGRFLHFEQLIGTIFGKIESDQDASDVRQIAYCAASDAEYFVTNDERILELSTEISDQLNLTVCTPHELFVYFDEKVENAKYSPSRLAGSLIKVKRPSADELRRLCRRFLRNKEGEKLRDFRRLILESVSERGLQHQLFVTEDEDENMQSVVGLRCTKERVLDVHIFRVFEGRLFSTLTFQLLQHLMKTAIDFGTNTIRISESYSSSIEGELVEFGFLPDDGGWIKILVEGVVDKANIGEVKNKLVSHNINESTVRSVFKTLENDDAIAHSNLEQKFWPLKIKGTRLPIYVVPIKPVWAKELFDHDIASEDLFGADPIIAFNLANAYYTASKIRFDCPARILWYVSMDAGTKYGGAIRATSYLDLALTGTAKELFKEFKRLGIYKWRDVLACASNRLDKQITGLKFSHTEMLSHPIGYNAASSLLKKRGINSNNFVAPLKVSEEFYFDVYLNNLT